MQRASALEAAARSSARLPNPAFADTAAHEAIADTPEPPPDRRLSDSNQAWLGRVVDGRYRVIEVIGRGGMGVVYRVEHLRMGKIAAMKVLHRDLARDADVVQRFEREAAAVSKLHHPHTVQVFDFGTAQGAMYLIMEYVRGLDLAHVIERDGPMPWARAAPLVAQICGALQEAHELGIVHRDLKPENVLITRTTGGRDYAKVLDFGLAKLDQRATPTSETGRQQIVGTPYFMSPEQIRGDEVDARSDIYSLGTLMFEVLTGQHLFVGSTAVGVLTKHLTAPPDAPGARAPKMGIDPRVDAVCLKALAKEPDARFATAAELAEAIEEVFAETVESATGPGHRTSSRTLGGGRLAIAPEEQAPSDLRLRRSDLAAFERGLRVRRVVLWAIAAFVVLGGAGAATWYALREPPPLTEEREPNDDVAHANVIAAGKPVTGYIGKRRSPEDGDRDVFVVPWPAGEKRVVTVRVTGVPNLDVNLAIADADGQHGATADSGGIGDGEVLHRRAIAGPLVITVGETMGKDQKLPVENVSDPYTLTVTEEPATGGETEPNNTDVDANPLEPGHEIRGYLDYRDDIDLVRWTGGDGNYDIVVRADAGLPLAWRIGDGELRTPGGAPGVALHRGDLIRLERTDRTGSGPLPGRDAMWSLVVTTAR
ncbi:MAG TPA: serine/threonine-protein kinase [Kofleriaceae bacterium]|nr:serine/threonine-protein kinase [Kofleriaceae bacterium]